jgi:transposase
VAPHARAGSVVYGPNINAAAVLVASEGNVPVERTAALMEALLGTPVSSGFVAGALARLAQRLQAAGFDEAMKHALQADGVLCGDDSSEPASSEWTCGDGQGELGDRARLPHIWVDNAYHGDWIAWARHHYGVTIEVVARPDGMKGFQVLPRRWAAERTLAWITRRRRARAYERLPGHRATMPPCRHLADDAPPRTPTTEPAKA